MSTIMFSLIPRRLARVRVGTALTEAANVLVNRRMNKAQPMRWSRRGADLLLQMASSSCGAGAEIWASMTAPGPVRAMPLA
jgi:hypothetical protein